MTTTVTMIMRITTVMRMITLTGQLPVDAYPPLYKKSRDIIV